MEHLYIVGWHSRWQDDIDDNQWLEVLLYLSRGFMSRIALAVQELAREMLPSLQKVLLEDFHPSDASVPVEGAIGKFVATRKLSSHPVAVFHSDRKQDKW